MNYKEIEALIKLLSDEDDFVLGQVEGKLMDYFNKIAPSIWSQLINDAPPISQERLKRLYEKYNRQRILDLTRRWLERPNMLSEGLFIIAKVFNPFLEYSTLLASMFNFIEYFPEDFTDNYTDLEQARFVTHLFYKQLGFKWDYNSPQYITLNPEYVLKNMQGSHITIALIIVALLQHLKIFWLVLSDMTLSHTYIVVPTDVKNNQYFFIDPRTGKIQAESPLSTKDVETLIKGSIEHYNLLSLKSLVVAYLRQNILPRKMDDQWYLINRINTMIADYGKKFST